MAQKSLFRTPTVTVTAEDEDEMPLYLNIPRSGYVCCTNFPVLQYLAVALRTMFCFLCYKCQTRRYELCGKFFKVTEIYIIELLTHVLLLIQAFK